MTRRALVTGVTGQDGSYMAEHLLERGYEVYGLVRRLSRPNLANLAAVRDHPRLHLVDGDLMDQGSLDAAVREAEPDEVYNYAAQSFVGTSFVQPVLTGEVTGLGALRVFEAVRRHADDARVFQASSSEMFGDVQEEPQTEATPFRPRSPYGVAKVYAYYAARNVREAYGIHIANGIMFNHESPRRGEEFVTRKIAMAAARIAREGGPPLTLGDVTARRDWGYAPEYVDFAHRTLQADEPDDYVAATGESHTVADFVEAAFAHAGVEDPWSRVRTSPDLHRPAEVYRLRGDASKAKRELGWTPQTRFDDLVRIMVDADLLRAKA